MQAKRKGADIRHNADAGQFCRLCHCWRGSLGLEPTPELYIEHLVGIFREVRRVLRDDATCWINIAGCYYSQGPRKHGDWAASGTCPQEGVRAGNLAASDIFKPKDWVPIPWMLGMALQRDGWWLRSPIIWAKPNPMPESVRDRPTKSYEYILLLTKQARYYWDQDAVREKYPQSTLDRLKYPVADHSVSYRQRQNGWVTTKNRPERTIIPPNPAGRNIRDVWTIPTRSFPGAHFATFPPKLVEPCIKAGTSERGCCPECEKGWERETALGEVITTGGSNAAKLHNGGQYGEDLGNRERRTAKAMTSREHRTTGWRPGCSCYQLFECAYCQYEEYSATQISKCPRCGGPIAWLSPKAGYEKASPVPCIVLDPFCGSGTTVMVALRLGRRAIGIDLSEEYCRMSRKRIIQDNPMFNTPGEAT